MPTNKPRLTVTLDPHRYELLKRLAKHQGQSAASILAELLETVYPVLERVCVALDQVSQAQDSIKPGLKRTSERALAAMEPLAQAGMAQFDMFLGTLDEQMGRPLDAAPPSAPAPPTRRPKAASTPRPVITGGRSRDQEKPKKPRKPVAARVPGTSRGRG